jgi:hypothetical protein
MLEAASASLLHTSPEEAVQVNAFLFRLSEPRHYHIRRYKTPSLSIFSSSSSFISQQRQLPSSLSLTVTLIIHHFRLQNLTAPQSFFGQTSNSSSFP